MFRVVADTNQFVSALISKHGAPARLLEAWQARRYILVLSEDILGEIRKALFYPKIMHQYVTLERVERFIQLLEHEAVIVRHLPKLHVIKEDPDDDKIFACAVAGRADYIVSGDSHLLNLHSFQNIPIVTVKEFLKLF